MTTPVTAITRVRVFDGTALSPERTVVIEDGVISSTTSAAEITVDGRGGTLLPGLIDTHVHIGSQADLQRCGEWGLTTVLDLGAPQPELIDSLRDRTGLPSLRSAGFPASAPGGAHTTRMGFPALTALSGPGDAAGFVAARVEQQADYVKIIVEDPKMPRTAALDIETITAVVTSAHQANLQVIAHAVTGNAMRMALDAGADVITHAPLGADLEAEFAELMRSRGTVLIPTLTMMHDLADVLGRKPMLRLLALLRVMPKLEYRHAQASVAICHGAGVTMLAGSDANSDSNAPASPAHGESLHRELGLLVAAGLRPIEALRAATVLPAEVFGLNDRGVIEPGRRADLLLVDGDPTVDIAATRAIRGVWIGGVRTR